MYSVGKQVQRVAWHNETLLRVLIMEAAISVHLSLPSHSQSIYFNFAQRQRQCKSTDHSYEH